MGRLLLGASRPPPCSSRAPWRKYFGPCRRLPLKEKAKTPRFGELLVLAACTIPQLEVRGRDAAVLLGAAAFCPVCFFSAPWARGMLWDPVLRAAELLQTPWDPPRPWGAGGHGLYGGFVGARGLVPLGIGQPGMSVCL